MGKDGGKAVLPILERSLYFFLVHSGSIYLAPEGAKGGCDDVVSNVSAVLVRSACSHWYDGVPAMRREHAGRNRDGYDKS